MNNRNNTNKKGQGSSGWKIAAVLCLAGALVCTAVACAGKESQSEAEEAYEELAEQTNVSADTPEPEATATPTAEPTEEPIEDPEAALREMGVPVPEKEVDFADLQANTNEDIYAWIYIPDTKVDYPVLQHPTDNGFYLNHNLDGSSGYPACIYSEDYNKKDFSDPLTVLYGHSMDNGTMFGGLHRYSDSQYTEEHPYIYIYTEDGMLVYEIFAVVEYSDVHLLYGHDYTNVGEMENFLTSVREVRDMNRILREDTLLEKGIEVTEESKVLALSTCVNPKPSKRFLVLGVLLNGEEE